MGPCAGGTEPASEDGWDLVGTAATARSLATAGRQVVALRSRAESTRLPWAAPGMERDAAGPEEDTHAEEPIPPGQVKEEYLVRDLTTYPGTRRIYELKPAGRVDVLRAIVAVDSGLAASDLILGIRLEVMLDERTCASYEIPHLASVVAGPQRRGR